MAYLTPGDFTNSMLSNPRGKMRALHRHAHLGGFAGSRSRAILAMQMAQNAAAASSAAAAAAAEANKSAMAQIQSARSGMEADLVKIQRAASAARDQAFQIQDMASSVDHPSALPLSQEAQDAALDIDTLAQEARKAYDDFDYEASAKRAAGGNYAVALLGAAEITANKIKSSAGRIARAGSVLAVSVGRLKSLQKRTADAAAQAQADADYAAQMRRDLADADAARTQQIVDERRAREAQAIQDERDFQQAQIEEQRRLTDLEREYEASERARIVEIEQRRMDAEMRREQQAISAEDRRMRLQEASALRVEEAALRREEREAQLQQLMLIQELAAQGLPSYLLPPGLPAPQPQRQPGLMPGFPDYQQGLVPRPGVQFFMPGFSPPQTVPSAIPAGAWSPYGQVVQGPGGAAPTGFPVQVPGVAFSPQGLPSGYAAQPAPAAYQQSAGFPQMQQPAYQQSAGFPQMQQPFPQQPSGEAPPGFAWSGFDPGTEMFGLGALQQTFNPNLQGALIEEGWTMEGPQDDGNYTMTRPNGQLFQRYTEAQLYTGSIRDETGNIVWVSPQQRPADAGGETARAVTADVASIIRAAIQATGSVMTAKEQSKAQKRALLAASVGRPAAVLSPAGGGVYDPGPTPPRTSALTIVAGVALAAGAFWGVSRLVKKKAKK